MQITRPAAEWRTWLGAGVALALLNASLTFANVWPTPKIRWQNALSVELAILVLVLAILRAPSSRIVRVVLPVVWLVLVIGRYLDVTAPGLYGRPFNLYWDAPHLTNVAAMFTDWASVWLLLAGVVALGLSMVAALLAIRVAMRWVAATMEFPRPRVALSALAAGIVVAYAIVQPSERAPGGSVFADPVTPAYVRQLRSVMAMMGPGVVAPDLGASPAALDAMPRLNGADVLLVFVESYGAVTFDSPTLAATLAPSRAAFEAAVRETGRQMVSAFVESPTFGGSSWLAHLSLLSGIEIRDPYSYQTLMTESRPTLVKTFARAGYRTVALMPGMRQAWPEGAFYGYDRIYGRDDLAYTGPQFGWWSIPDQYALAKLDALEGPRGSRAPLFAVFPTSTTHAPFGPVAPYQPRWLKVLTDDAYDRAEVQGILSHQPDWTNLSADYAHAMSYEFTTFAGYLRERAGDELVMILVGDHQPPAMVAGEGAPWTVPVHVIASDSGIIQRLLAQDFRPGLTPTRPSLGPMHTLLAMLVNSFASQGA